MSASRSAPAGATPAPYGKACLNCAKAKCRCIYQNDRSRCQRCHRLDKECTPSVSVRKRRPGRVSTSRTSRLESKLDDLVSLLRTQGPDQGRSSSDTNTTQDPDTTGTPDTPWSSHSDEESSGQGQGSNERHSKPGFAPSSPREVLSHVYDRCFTAYHPYESRNQPPPTLSAQFETSPEAAEAQFAIFRDKMLVNFPFVCFPPDMTAAELRRTSPFLWFNINIVTTKERQRQLAMATHMKHYISQAMVVANEKRFEFLQGLMIYLAWPQYYYNMKPGHSVITGLATSLVFDLGLNRDPAALPKPLELPCMKRVSPSSSDNRTTNERRAVLGLFYLLSQISFTWKKIEIPSWSSYMDDCMTKLSQGSESDNDHILVALVQIQLVVHQNLNPSGSTISLSPTFIPTLQARLQTIRDQLPASVRNLGVVVSHLLYADLVTQESVLFKSASPTTCPPAPPPSSNPSNPHSASASSQSSSSNNTTATNSSHQAKNNMSKVPTTQSWVPDYARHAHFVAHRDTIKAWFSWFLTLPTPTYGHVTTVVSCAMTHFLVCLYRLTMLRNADDPSWDPGLLLLPRPSPTCQPPTDEREGEEDSNQDSENKRNNKKTKREGVNRADPDLDLLQVCDRMICRLEESGRESGRMDDREFWRKGVRMIASLRQGWAAEIQQHRQQYGGGGAGEMDVDEEGGAEAGTTGVSQNQQQQTDEQYQQPCQPLQQQQPQQQDMMMAGGNIGMTGPQQVDDGLAGLDVMLGTEPSMIGFEFMDYEALLPDLFYAS